MRLDSSVEGERAGGAGGGASRPTPVAMGDKSRGVRVVSDSSHNIYMMKNTSKSNMFFYDN